MFDNRGFANQHTTNAKPVRALFVQSGTYNDQHRRPITTGSLDLGTLSKLEIVTQGGTNLTRTAIAQVASDILKPQTESEGIATIDYGWGEVRSRFMIEFSITMAGGLETRKVMTGYTSHMGISGQGHFDPSMKVYINNVTTLRQSAIMQPGVGRIMQSSIVGNDSVLMGKYVNGGTTPNDFALRPMDVFQNMISDSAVMEFAGDGMVGDKRATFGAGPMFSERGYAFNSEYVSRMLNAAKESFQLQSDGVTNIPAVYRAAAGLVGERTIVDDQIIRALYSLPSHNYRNFGFVTWAELRGLFPDLEHIAQVIFPGGAHAKTTDHRQGQTEYWHTSTPETIVATQISQALPGLMMECMIGRIGLTITNNTIGGKPHVVVNQEPMALSQGIDLAHYVDALKTNIMLELVPGITHNNYALLTVNVICDIFAETRLSISFNGGPVIDYCAPTFCDSRYSPLITSNANVVSKLRNDFSNILGNLGHSNDTFAPVSHQFTSQVPAGVPQTGFSMPSFASAPQQAPSSSIITSTERNNKWM